MASWATRTPAIRDILSVSIAEMGGVLFGLSIGSMSGILCSAWLVKRFGTRNVILVTMSCALIGMMILSLALWLTSPLLFAVGLGVFGASFGSAEVAINVEGAAVEREMNKTVLPMMHGFYSLGTLAGAGVGMALTAFGVPATVHILLAALVGIAPIYIAIQAIPDGTGKNAADGTQHGEKGVPFYRDIQLLLIGVVVLAMAFAEGSASDNGSAVVVLHSPRENLARRSRPLVDEYRYFHVLRTAVAIGSRLFARVRAPFDIHHQIVVRQKFVQHIQRCVHVAAGVATQIDNDIACMRFFQFG